MGLDVYGQLVVGIRVSKGDFWQVTGKERKCVGCLRRQENGKFCAECGQKICEVAKEGPTPVLQAAMQIGELPEAAWERLTKDYNPNGKMLIHAVEGIIDGGTDDHNLALGIRIVETDSHCCPRSSDKIVAFPTASIEGLSATVRAEADRLGIPADRPAEIFCSIYLSY